MSSRTENGDPCGTIRTWTAYRGPCRTLLRTAPGRGGPVMSSHETGPKDRNNPPGAPNASAGWAITSYLIGGMICYGGIGWLIGRWTGIAVLFPIGILFGLGLALALVIFRYARP